METRLFVLVQSTTTKLCCKYVLHRERERERLEVVGSRSGGIALMFFKLFSSLLSSNWVYASKQSTS